MSEARAGTDCRIASGALIVVNEGATTSGIDFSLDAGATISGTVVSDGTLTPLANVRVAAFAGTVQVADAAGFGTIGTDGVGQYTIRGLPPGTYRVRTMSGPSRRDYVNEWYSDVCVGCPGTPAGLAVGPGAPVTGINFSLADRRRISGRVTWAPGSTRVAGPEFTPTVPPASSPYDSGSDRCSRLLIERLPIEGLSTGQSFCSRATCRKIQSISCSPKAGT